MPVTHPHSGRARAPEAARTQEQAGAFRQAVLLAVLVAAAAVAAPLRAQDPSPGRERTGTPQAVGAAHTVRTIPEACTRLEGVFTGEAAQPYRLQAVASAPGCRPRARWVDAAGARPAQAAGWLLGDVVRIPDAACPSRQAVVRVWRKPVDQPLERDGQGRVRIYLQDAKKQAAAGELAPLPQFSAELEQPGPCSR